MKEYTLPEAITGGIHVTVGLDLKQPKPDENSIWWAFLTCGGKSTVTEPLYGFPDIEPDPCQRLANSAFTSFQVIIQAADLHDFLAKIPFIDQYGPEAVTETIDTFKHPELLHHIWKELDSDHVGDDRVKMLAFLCVATAYMRPEYRVSFTVRGNSTAGKDNLLRAVLKHTDRNVIGRFTAQTDKWLTRQMDRFGGLSVGELNLQRKGGANQNVIEYLKAAIEGGIRYGFLDKDEHGKIVSAETEVPQMMIAFTSTEIAQDDELSTRVLSIPVDGSEAQTRAVINRIVEADDFADAEESQSWIMCGLGMLDGYAAVVVPKEIKKVLGDRADVKDVRARRDYKRLIAIIRASAWVHQLQRPRMGSAVVAVAADVAHALHALGDVLDQTYTGVEPRLQRIIDVMSELTLEYDDGWVPRQKLCERLGIRGKHRQKDAFRELEAQLIIRGRKSPTDGRFWEYQLTGRTAARFLQGTREEILAALPTSAAPMTPISLNQDTEPTKLGAESVPIGADAYPCVDFVTGEIKNRDTGTYKHLIAPIEAPNMGSKCSENADRCNSSGECGGGDAK